MKTTHTLTNAHGDVWYLSDAQGNHLTAFHAVSAYAAQTAATRALVARGEYNPAGHWTRPRAGQMRYRVEP